MIFDWSINRCSFLFSNLEARRSLGRNTQFSGYLEIQNVKVSK